MANRITRKNLDALADRINDTLGVSRDVWNNGVANVGTHYVAGAYGGYQFQRIATASGGVESITDGYQPARAVYTQMRAYLRGISAGAI